MGWTPEARKRQYLKTMKAKTWSKKYAYVLADFQKLRRLECADRNGWVSCITCEKRIQWNACDGGHFIRSAANRGVCFHRDNVWPQCKHCNDHLSGNVAVYRVRLIEKIGQERFDALCMLAADTRNKRHSEEELADLKLGFLDAISIIT